ncbi:MAG: Gfo/Idh/MocA family oxidoreductase, partial [Verrucomicrobiae bacterium]|nr:Gfo/Idh/MocA family oxidoreductase [Verrucomicrobiae bacterium]
MSTSFSRRKFLTQSALAASGGIFFPAVIPNQVLAKPGRILPNDRIHLGFIGVGEMGSGHVRTFLHYDDVRIVAICDVRKEHRDRAKTWVDQHYGSEETATYNDFREMLARPDIDAVVLALPDHWHVMVGLEAARQGKAMYYEKGMCRYFEEAQAMRETVNRFNTIFQFGTQQRSDPLFRHAVGLVRNGYLGDMKHIVIGSAGGDNEQVVPVEPTEIPEGLDYDFWLGPAPWVPYTTLRCTRNWTAIRDYSLGCIGSAWGIHHVDIAQWALDADHTGPIAVEGEGVIPRRGLYDTIRSWTAEHTYANGVKVLHCDQQSARRRFPQFNNGRTSMGILMEGNEGWVYVARGYIDAHPKRLLSTVISPNKIKVTVSNDHRRNFLDAVRTGTDPICPVGPAVRSETLSQQADIAIRLGQRLEWDPMKERFTNSEAANRMLATSMRS